MSTKSKIVYCESIRNDLDYKRQPQANIINILSSIEVLTIPTHFSFWVSVSVSGVDVKRDNIIKIDFNSSNGELIFSTNDVPIPKINNEYENTNLQFNIELKNIFLKEVGDYTTSLYLNEEKIDEAPIEISLSTT